MNYHNIKSVLVLTALSVASFSSTAADLEGFKTIRFGMNEADVVSQGFKCSDTTSGGRICTSYNFDSNAQSYAKQNITIFEIQIASASVQFNKQGKVNYVSIGIGTDKCSIVFETMKTTLGIPVSRNITEPNLNKKQTMFIARSTWNFENATMSHVYADLGIRGVAPSCDIVFNSTKYKDQPLTKSSKDF